MPDYERIPLGSVVRMRDAKPGAIEGKVIKRLRANVGAPYMVKVQWPAGKATYNERLLEAVK